MKVGNTPLVKLDSIGTQYKCDLWAKLEYLNLTGSHKDRESIMVVEEMKLRGFKECAIASSGNAGLSLSYFCWLEHLRCHLFIPTNGYNRSQTLLSIFSPVVHKASSYREATKLLRNLVAKKHVYNANAGECKARIKGDEKILDEIMAEISPTVVVCPINNGTLFNGLRRGIKNSDPSIFLVGVKAPATKLAHSLSGFYNLEKTYGRILEVDDQQIADATRQLAYEGHLVEPASATVVAVLPLIRETLENRTVCVVLTGYGLKYPSELAEALK